MRTARAHYGRTDGSALLGSNVFLCLKSHYLCDKRLRELSADGEDVLAVNAKTERLAVVFYDRIKLLDNDESVNARSEIKDKLCGKGIYETELEDGNAVSVKLLDVLIAGTRGDDTER